VQLFAGHQLTMFLAPCAIGGLCILVFAARLDDHRVAPAEPPAWSMRELARTFYVSPRGHPDFAWAFTSRFLFVLAYAFLTTYQAYYLIARIGAAQRAVPHEIFLGTLTMAAVTVPASLLGGQLSDRSGRRKVFVCVASVVFGLALFVIAVTTAFSGYLVGMAIGGLGFGLYMAVDLALVTDVLPDATSAAKDLGVMNIAGALPSAIAPATAPVILALGHGSYGLLYAVAGACALLGAAAVVRVRGVG
jgi:MFS family permease